MMKKFNDVSYIFPDRIKIALLNLPCNVKSEINEIRVRVLKPLILIFKNTNFFIDSSSNLNTEVTEQTLFIGKKDISEIFEKICNYSVYSYQNEIKNGFLTLKGGHRIGICGTAVFNNEKIENIKNISSLNIRISKDIQNFNLDIYNLLNINFTGILIIGPPGSGKTTILKNLARVYSTKNINLLNQVCVIDERGELSGTYLGESQTDLGYSDILNGYKKSDGINHAIRAFSPDIIICDEIMDKDINVIKYGANCGVKFIASMHAKNPRELLNKPFINELLKYKIFDKFIFLSGKADPSKIVNILSLNDLIRSGKVNC